MLPTDDQALQRDGFNNFAGITNAAGENGQGKRHEI
jgi:hypothetical protein